MTDGPARQQIRTLTPTVCALFGIDAPRDCAAAPHPSVLAAAAAGLAGGRAERCLVFAPDAMGDHLRARCGELFASVEAAAPLRVDLRAEVPSMTPVCFASMFTGAEPARHGIRRYEKPVLACDTLFDAIVRAGRRVAIVAVQDSSIDRIFRGRPLDYFSEKYDPWVTDRAIRLLARGEHELIVAYHQEYDDVMHSTGPFAPRALRGARNSVEAFADLAAAFHASWQRLARVLVFAPDHGAHDDPATGGGNHGTEAPEDMLLGHYYGFWGRGGKV